MVRRLGLGKNNHLTYASLALNPRDIVLIVLGFNDTSTLVGQFLSSPREREKRDSRGDGREGQGR